MKRIIAYILCFTIIFGTIFSVGNVNVSAEDESEISVLFIGNSFTKFGSVQYGIASILNEMTRATGKNLKCKSIRNTAAHMSYYAYPTPNHPEYYKAVSEEIMNNKWDYIVLQDMSTKGVSNAENEMYPAIKTINDLVLRYQENSKVLLYSTYGYDNGNNIEFNGSSQKFTIEQFQREVAKSYDELGRELGVDVIPVGMMFLHCNKLYPNINLYSDDLKHASYIGYHLAAATFYNYFYHEVPKVYNSDLKYSDVSDDVLEKVNSLVDDRIEIDSTYKEIGVGESFYLSENLIEDDYVRQETAKESDTSVEETVSVEESGENETETAWVEESGENEAKTEPVTGETTEIEDATEINTEECCETTSESFEEESCEECTEDLPTEPVTDDMQGNPDCFEQKMPDKNLSYFIMNKNIIEVDEYGEFTAVGEGRTAIIVQTNSGLQAICQVNVTSHKNEPIYFNRSYYQVGQGDTIRVTPNSSMHINMFDYTWKAYNKKIAKVGYDGSVVSFMPGRTYIRITKKGNSSITARYMLYVQCPTPKNVEVVNLYPGDKDDSAAINQVLWNKVYGAKSYKIYRSEKSTSGYKLIATIQDTSYFDLNAKTGVTLYYKIVATVGYSATNSEYSEAASVYVPAIPVITEVRSNKYKTAITWTKDENATSYILYRGEKAGGAFKKIAVINNKNILKYIDKEVNNKSKYFYKVVTVVKTEDDTIYTDKSYAVSN